MNIAHYLNILLAVVLLSILFETSTVQVRAEETISDNTIKLELNNELSNLDSPESVLPSFNQDFLYVSNINGEATEKNLEGYIARVSLDGELIERKWAKGLNAPKGMALLGQNLFVADIDQLVIIDVSTGTVLSRVNIPEAGFLNDVVNLDDKIYISDSANARIYQYVDGNISVLMENDRLAGVNGLLADRDNLLITTMDAGELLSLDLETKSLSLIADGMKNADGLSILDDGSYLVSSWPGRMYHVTKSGEINTILNTESVPIFINDFYQLGAKLIVPNWQPGSLQFYTIEKVR